jgi:hypothetical protein
MNEEEFDKEYNVQELVDLYVQQAKASIKPKTNKKDGKK